MSYTRYISPLACFFVFCALCPITAQAMEPDNTAIQHKNKMTDDAQQVYRAFGDAVYQIQVIDLASGKKSSIGSGFQFTPDGLIATNYHVVASAIRHPQDNKLEYLHEKLGRHALTVVAADVVNDLAILKPAQAGTVYLRPGTSQSPKGQRLFSFGNPHDIGFTIVEGTNNGHAQESFIDKLHFSGALNPGMSGGPTLTRQGEVVGINVSTAGNQIGFLVPVEKLADLYHDLRTKNPQENFMDHAAASTAAQLLDAQRRNMDTLLAQDWTGTHFGPFVMPVHIHDTLKCWGNPLHEQTDLFQQYYVGCETQDNIFIDNRFDTGTIRYWHTHLSAKPALSTPRFYSLYEDQFAAFHGEKNASEDDVTNFTCNTRFVTLAGHKWKAAFCTRQYKAYPALYDAQLYLALLGQPREGVISFVSMEGVSQDSAIAFTEKFMRAIAPHPADGETAP